MNMQAPGPIKKGDTAATAMRRVVSLAERKSKSEKEYEPIILKIIDESKKKWRITCDTFVMSQEQTRRGINRTIKIDYTEDVNFKRRAQFVLDEDTMDVFLAIPSTQYNIDLLATHLNNNFWTIEPEKFADKAKKRWEEMLKERDVEAPEPVEGLTERNFLEEAREIVKKDDEFVNDIRQTSNAYWLTNEFKSRVKEVEKKLKEEALVANN